MPNMSFELNVTRHGAGDIYGYVLRHILEYGMMTKPSVSKTSPSFGKGTIEIITPRITLRDPRSRLIWNTARPINLGFAVGNFLYFLRAFDDVESMDYYNPMAGKFSDDGVKLHGAYGPRVMEQLYRVLGMLRENPSTRRAVVTFFDGHRDHVESKDIPCPISVQGIVRDGELIMVTTFRSQNMLMVYPYDIFLFTMIHEYCATQLGLRLGPHIQLTTSLHIYDSETDQAQKVAMEPSRTYTMPAMEPIGYTQTILLFEFEQMMRAWGLGKKEQRPPVPETLSPYWQGVCRLLGSFAELRRQGERVLRDLELFKRAWWHDRSWA